VLQARDKRVTDEGYNFIAADRISDVVASAPTGVNPLRGESRGRTQKNVTAWVKRSKEEEREREREEADETEAVRRRGRSVSDEIRAQSLPPPLPLLISSSLSSLIVLALCFSSRGGRVTP